MKPLLKDLSLNEKFLRNGFLKMPVFSVETIQEIAELYEQTRLEHEEVGKTQLFHSTQDSANYELSDFIDKTAKEILTPWIEEKFQNFKILMANFILKEPGDESVLEPHQDWNFVDEKEFISFNIWTPIMETNRNNGSLRFLPESHQIMDTIRPNYNYPWAYDDVKELIKENLVEVPTKLGESVLLNHGVIHASWPNKSENTRVALVICLVPDEATLKHYYCDDGETISEYNLNLETLKGLRYQAKPGEELLEKCFKYEFPRMTKAEMEKWIEKKRTQEKRTIS